MFTLRGYTANAAIREQAEMETILGHLETFGYQGIVRSAVRGAAQAAGVDPSIIAPAELRAGEEWSVVEYEGEPSSRLAGEVFVGGEAAYVLQPLDTRLAVLEIRRHTTPSTAGDFLKQVTESARLSLDGRRLRGMSFDWEEAPIGVGRPRVRRTDDRELTTESPSYTAAEAAASELLVIPSNKLFLRRLAQLTKMRSVDAAGSGEDQAIATRLHECGLLRKEYLVVCRQDSRTIAGTHEESSLTSAEMAHLRCTLCGRAFSDELIQDIFAVTDEGRSLLDSSRWMTIWVTEVLSRLGIGRNEIVWNAEAGEDEVDVIVSLAGERIFFELKDREFGLGDAYPFAFRVARYSGNRGVVISTERIGEEAVRFLEEQGRGPRGLPIETVAGDGAHIASELERLVDRVARQIVQSAVRRATARLPIGVWPIVDAWMGQR
jgi:hypothetical protein